MNMIKLTEILINYQFISSNQPIRIECIAVVLVNFYFLYFLIYALFHGVHLISIVPCADPEISSEATLTTFF